MTMNVAGINYVTSKIGAAAVQQNNNGTMWDGAVDGVNTGIEIKGNVDDLKGDFAEIKGDIKDGNFGEIIGDFKDLKGDAQDTIQNVKDLVGIAKNLAGAANDPFVKKQLDKFLADGKIDKNELALILTGLAKECTEEAYDEDPKGYLKTAGGVAGDLIKDKAEGVKDKVVGAATWLWDNTLGRIF